jgi:hypothetical protein
LEAGSSQTVLLHFSGYGYASSGLCWWLVDGVRRWKAGGSARRLVTIFHEVHATWLPWRRSLLTALPQRRIARDLAAMSDAALTTSQTYAEKLRGWRRDLRVTVTPVFSNVGEFTAAPPLHTRGPFGVVFGQWERQALLWVKGCDAWAWSVFGTLVPLSPNLPL